MKRLLTLFTAISICCGFWGCSPREETAEIAATTLPVYTFTSALCDGTDLTVRRLITESVSCLHDYTLQVSQMRTMEAAEVIVINGAGLEDFLGEAVLNSGKVIDSSHGIEGLHCDDTEHHDHHHEADPHLWLSPDHAKQMAHNIYLGLSNQYPQHTEIFQANLAKLNDQFAALKSYAQTALSDLSCRELITFHDGFGYMAEAFGLEVLFAIEEESGSEASAAELIALAQLIRTHNLRAIFTEENGSTSAASIVAAETNVTVYTLDMAMVGNSYFDAMYKNIDTLKEALE